MTKTNTKMKGVEEPTELRSHFFGATALRERGERGRGVGGVGAQGLLLYYEERVGEGAVRQRSSNGSWS